jgi:radical SAM superfamily enzyme with C-terminal helix-hairpin-helix motif
MPNSSLPLEDILDKARKQLDEQTNEHDLQQCLMNILTDAETLYRADRTQFSEKIIVELQGVRDCQQALEEFLEVCEDLADVRSKEEARELKDQLREISSHFEHHAVRGRIEKEYRELSQKRIDLPSEAVAHAETKLKSHIAQLNSSPPDCTVCGSPLVLHLGRRKPFWGCSTFPKCYGKKWLSKDQREFLDVE